MSRAETISEVDLDELFNTLDPKTVADFKNVGTRYGGSIVAALFLKEFVPNDIPWAHLDIAGPARAESESDAGPKGGTGVATRTLIAWLIGRGR